MRRLVAVDVDGVCADLLSEWLRRYNARFGDSVRPEDVDCWDFYNHLGCATPSEVLRLLSEPGLYLNVRPHAGALEAVRALQQSHDVLFVSDCAPGARDQKAEWLERRGFVTDATREFCSLRRKEWLRADVLIDDGPHNADAFPGTAFLIAQPHNRHYAGNRARLSLGEAALALTQGRPEVVKRQHE